MARILVVEDDRTLREILRLYLTTRGHSVECASDALAALQALLQSEFNLVLTDLRMPHMSGIEFIRSVRSDSRIARVPVVCLTTKTDDESWMEATEAGADGYLTKPVKAEDLAVEINRVLLVAGQGREQSRPEEGEKRLA